MSNAGLPLALPFLDPSSMAATSSMPSLKDHTLATHPLRLGGTEKNWKPLCWVQPLPWTDVLQDEILVIDFLPLDRLASWAIMGVRSPPGT